MKLEETLQLLALQLNLDPQKLIEYAAEDSIGGWDLGKGNWPIGSLWNVEGQTLYALVRELKPEHVVQIGDWRGCSATHLATALQINESGHLTSVDIQEGAGDLLPPGLASLVTKVAADGAQWLREQPDSSIDFIFEDADHSTELCRVIAQIASAKLKPGGVLIVHDAAHDYAWLGDMSQIHSDVGETVRRGLEMSLGDSFRVYRADPSDCGYAAWQKPGAAKTQGFSADDGYTYASGNVLAGAIEQARAQASAQAQPVDGEKPKREFTTADGATLEVVDAQPTELGEGSFEAMTKASLLEYAATHGYEIKGTRTKPDIIAQIIEAQAAENKD